MIDSHVIVDCIHITYNGHIIERFPPINQTEIETAVVRSCLSSILPQYNKIDESIEYLLHQEEKLIVLCAVKEILRLQYQNNKLFLSPKQMFIIKNLLNSYSNYSKVIQSNGHRTAIPTAPIEHFFPILSDLCLKLEQTFVSFELAETPENKLLMKPKSKIPSVIIKRISSFQSTMKNSEEEPFKTARCIWLLTAIFFTLSSGLAMVYKVCF